jgi:hypothetical protein
VCVVFEGKPNLCDDEGVIGKGGKASNLLSSEEVQHFNYILWPEQL